MSKALCSLLIVSMLLTVIGCINMQGKTSPPLPVVPYVDLTRYTGTWYEIARYPHSFQEGCVGSKATYSLRKDGKISVFNECYDNTFDGKIRSAKGKAWVVDKKTNAKLKVSFFWPFAGDYWIVDLGENYEYAVIGHPKRQYLWILSRSKEIKGEVYETILSRLKDKQYDTSKLIKTLQK
ncbi:MAG: lipocalin family protein [Nitrospira sp.]|nr:lipocalin family protein [Nitrospira sp.]